MIFDLDKNIFGLDISDRALRLIQLKKKGKKTVLSSYNEIVIPEGIITNGVIIDENNLIKLLHQLITTVKGDKINTKKVISVLPETKTFIKVIEITPIEKEEVATTIEKEIKNHIPLSPEEIYFDWQILKTAKNSTKVLIGAAPRNIVDSYVDLLGKSNLTPYVLEIEAAAIIRSLIAKNDNKSKIIIDFGAARTGLIIYDQGTVQFTISLPTSGNKITTEIAKTLKIEAEKAEKAKIVCGLDPNKCEGALLKVLMSSINILASQIKKAMVFYKTNFPNRKSIEEIILCGGGANFSNINKVLQEKLNMPVRLGNPLTNSTQKKKLAIPNNKLNSHATAIGLALRAFEKKNLL